MAERVGTYTRRAVLAGTGGLLLAACGSEARSTKPRPTETIGVTPQPTRPPPERRIWTSADTQADSRDRVLLLGKDSIQQKVADIAALNATHIGIGTPYDSSDTAMMDAAGNWIKAARDQGLNILWRSAQSKWEGWFNVPKDTNPKTYPGEIYDFIKAHPEFFQNGDMFDPCAEAENMLDVYNGNNKYVYRKFLADVNRKTKEAFHEIGRDGVMVIHSMNGDVPGLLGYDSQDGMNVVTDVLENRLYFDWSPYNFTVNPPPYDLQALLSGLKKWQQTYPGAAIHLTETGITLSDIAAQVGNHPDKILSIQAGRVSELLSGLVAMGVRGIQYYALDNKDSSLEAGSIKYPSYEVVKRDFGKIKEGRAVTTSTFSSIPLGRRELLAGMI